MYDWNDKVMLCFSNIVINRNYSNGEYYMDHFKCALRDHLTDYKDLEFVCDWSDETRPWYTVLTCTFAVDEKYYQRMKLLNYELIANVGYNVAGIMPSAPYMYLEVIIPNGEPL